jgi:hypothetical protein
LHVATCSGEPPELFFPTLSINEIRSSVPLVEASLDDRTMYTMLLIGAVEERANVTVLSEGAADTPANSRRFIFVST